MNRLIKGCLITSMVLAILGGVGCAAGLAFGAESVTEALPIDGDNVVAEVASTIVNGNWDFLSDDYEAVDWDSLDAADYTEDTYTFEQEEAANISTNLKVGDIVWRESDTEQVEVSVKQKNYQVSVSSEDGTLTIKGDDKKLSSYINTSCYIVVALPAGMTCEDVEITGNYGDVTFESDFTAQNMKITSSAGDVTSEKVLKADSMELTSSAGDMELNQLQAGKASVTCSAGDITVKGQITGDVDLTCSAGDITVSGAIKGNMDITCSVGDVDMQLEGSKSDYNYEISGGLGEVNIDDENYGETRKNVNIDNGADSTITVKCSLGEVDITF